MGASSKTLARDVREPYSSPVLSWRSGKYFEIPEGIAELCLLHGRDSSGWALRFEVHRASPPRARWYHFEVRLRSLVSESVAQDTSLL
jgi:hypothetical protein